MGTHIVWMQNRVSQRCFISLIVRPLPWLRPVQSDGQRDGRSVGRLLLCSVFVHSILIKDKPSSRLALLWLSVIATLTREPLNLVGFLWHMLPGLLLLPEPFSLAPSGLRGIEFCCFSVNNKIGYGYAIHQAVWGAAVGAECSQKLFKVPLKVFLDMQNKQQTQRDRQTDRHNTSVTKQKVKSSQHRLLCT